MVKAKFKIVATLGCKEENALWHRYREDIHFICDVLLSKLDGKYLCASYICPYIFICPKYFIKNHYTCCPLHLLSPSRVALDGNQRTLTPAWLYPFPSTSVDTLSPSQKCAQKRTSLRDGLAQATSGHTVFLQFRVSSSHEPPEPRLLHRGKSWKPVIPPPRKSRKVHSLGRESKPFHNPVVSVHKPSQYSPRAWVLQHRC